MNPKQAEFQQSVHESFSQKLKNATAAAHTELESTALSRQLLQPDLSVNRYREYLEKMYALNLFTEEQVAPDIADHVPDLAARSKTAWLQHDLQQLNTPLPDALAYAEVRLENIAEKMGWYYVVEGSTLGGRVILKTLRLNLPPDIFENATLFFNGYGDNTGKYWKNFLARLEQFAQTPEARESVIEGANKAFNQIKKAFNT